MTSLRTPMIRPSLLLASLFLLGPGGAGAAPVVSRLTPPSELFASGRPDPVIARFLPGQRFDFQATLRPDAGRQIVEARFLVDGKPVAAPVALFRCNAACVKGVPGDAVIATVRAFGIETPGRHEFGVVARTTGRR